MKCVKHLIDSEYESSNAASQKVFLIISILITFDIFIYRIINEHYHWHNKKLKNSTEIIGDAGDGNKLIKVMGNSGRNNR